MKHKKHPLRPFTLWLNDSRVPRRTYSDLDRARSAAITLLLNSKPNTVVSVYNEHSLLRFEGKRQLRQIIILKGH